MFKIFVFFFFCFNFEKSFQTIIPFVTKRVQIHNPINIDYMGWRPLRQPQHDQMQVSASHADTQVVNSGQHESISGVQSAQESGTPVSLDNHFLTVPVAVETDAEHVLSETDLNQIREHVITNWKQREPLKSESFPHLTPFVPQLLPKPEIELKEEIREQIREESRLQSETEGGTTMATEKDNTEYTFVKMDKNLLNSNSSSENLFHAYFAAKDHIPPDGYIRLTKNEFKNLFKNAEILLI